MCGGTAVGREDNGKKDDELNFGCIAIEMHGGYSVVSGRRQLYNHI